MFTIVAVVGSRTFNDYPLLCETLDAFLAQFDKVALISGGARGADQLAERYALEHSILIQVLKPDWSVGRHAGLLRNADIVKACDHMVAFQRENSRGTANSIERFLASKPNGQLLRA